MDSGGSTLFVLTWKVRTTPSGSRILARRAWAPRTRASDCSSSPWPTPLAVDGRGSTHSYSNGNHDTPALKLTGAARLASWGTPTASEAGGSAEAHVQRKIDARAEGKAIGASVTALSIQAQMATWPTPKSSDAPRGGASRALQQSHQGSNLNDTAMLAGTWPTPTRHDADHASTTETDLLPGCAHLASAWPTPLRADGQSTRETFHHGSGNPTLLGAARAAWPTPTSLTPATDENREAGDSCNLRKIRLLVSGDPASGSPAPTGRRGQLNPELSRWLMGLPAEWSWCAPEKTGKAIARARTTESARSADTATRSSARSRRGSSRPPWER